MIVTPPFDEAKLEKLWANIALLEFRRQIDHSLSVEKMVDGIADEYEDQAGVDTGASSGQVYDATNDLYSAGRTVADAQTKALIEFNGTDGATTYTAESGQTVTFAGTAQLDTAQKKFGTASLLLDGNSDYITLPDSDDWFLDAGNGSPFTIDMWVRLAVLQNGNIFSQGTNSNNHFTAWFQNDNKTITVLCYAGASVFYFSCPFNPSINTWYHIAIVRVDNTNAATGWRIFVDGVSQTLTLGSGSWGASLPANYASPFYIGYGLQPSYGYFNGWIDEVRISKGVARWTSNFTPATDEWYVPSSMNILSVAANAVTEPKKCRLFIFEEDINTVTVNTDLMGYASRDGGTTWTQIPLASLGAYETGKNIIGGVAEISGQPAGTSMKYKIVTANQKNMKIHGTGLLWQ